VVRCSEVDHFDLAAVPYVDEDVLRLEVAVRNVLAVAVGDRLQDLLENESSLGLAEVVPLRNLVEELAAIAQLSHQVDATLVLIDFEQAHDVRVRQVLENVYFVLQTDVLLLVKLQLVDDLDCPFIASVFVRDFAHQAKRARSKHFRLHVVVLIEGGQALVFTHEVLLRCDYVVFVPDPFGVADRDEFLDTQKRKSDSQAHKQLVTFSASFTSAFVEVTQPICKYFYQIVLPTF